MKEANEMVAEVIKIHTENVENFYDCTFNGVEYETIEELLNMYFTNIVEDLDLDEIQVEELNKAEKALRIIYGIGE